MCVCVCVHKNTQFHESIIADSKNKQEKAEATLEYEMSVRELRYVYTHIPMCVYVCAK